jgi:hypothetical protein|tara:strand:- start:199 stop:468 length:270 start_codon:yes stop_codon:yes gene_type:complete
MDGRQKNGGIREGAGRPKKVDEEKLVAKLDAIIDSEKVIAKLGEMCLKGDTRALTLYFNYRFGKPTEKIDISATEGFNLNFKDLIQFGD